MPTIEHEYVETHAKSRALHEHADGARKSDVNGHAYLDCWSGHGALILGHNHPAIVAAIAEQAKRGLPYSA